MTASIIVWVVVASAHPAAERVMPLHRPAEADIVPDTHVVSCALTAASAQTKRRNVRPWGRWVGKWHWVLPADVLRLDQIYNLRFTTRLSKVEWYYFFEIHEKIFVRMDRCVQNTFRWPRAYRFETFKL